MSSPSGLHLAQPVPAAHRGPVPPGAGRVRRRCLRGRHRGGGDPHHARQARPGGGAGYAQGRARGHQLRGQAQEARQAPEAGRVLHPLGQPAGMDDPGGRAGDPAGAAPPGAAGRWPLRHLRPQRSLPPRHQPQQPAEAADRAAGAGHHRPQRKAHAAGGGGRALRQRPPRPGDDRRQQAPAKVAQRHAQGQAGALPPEPAGQARRLFRPLGDRRRARTQAARVRAAEEDGARALQALHLLQARALRHGDHAEGRQAPGREGTARGLGHPGGGDPRASGPAQPGADAASARHPGLRAGADRGQGDPASSRWSAPPSTRTSTATRWRCTCRFRRKRSSRRGC